MKTRQVKIIGLLHTINDIYRLIRVEPTEGLANNATGFTVVQFESNDDGIYYAPFFIVSTSWTIVYNEPYEIKIEDDTETEVDAIDTPTQADITEAEWEFLLNNLENTNKEN